MPCLMREKRSLFNRPIVVGTLLVATLGCHDLSGLAGTQSLPAGTPNPNVYHTAAGAMALYQMTLAAFQPTYGVQTISLGGAGTDTTTGAFVDYMFQSGRLTDELQAGDLGCAGVGCSFSASDSLDARHLPDGARTSAAHLYDELQGIRNDVVIAGAALATYDSGAPRALRGHLHALAGYAELMLADLFCSGVPLGSITFNGDFVYAPGSTTDQVYQAAIAQFDTALAMSSDSARIENLAWVGKGRALLALDSLPQAAQAAAHVPDGFTYQLLVDWTGRNGELFADQNATEGDREGINGLPYISSGDPRTAAQVAPQSNNYGLTQYLPVKYGGATPTILPITVGDWIEARLIQAEAALVANPHDPAWLTVLNTLRQTATVAGQAAPLPVLTDPGDTPGDTARVNLLFRERAYWLFLTGHRQGDLRRLIRQYHHNETQVYPVGPYSAGAGLSSYGSDVTVPIPPLAEIADPSFHGCLSRGA